jgi:hypothetical protein
MRERIFLAQSRRGRGEEGKIPRAENAEDAENTI